MTDEEPTILSDEDAMSDAEIALEAVEFALENPSDDVSPEILRGAADTIGYRREDTGQMMDEAAQMLEDGDYESAQRKLGPSKVALEMVVTLGDV
jgi:hypothetical protein